MDKKRKIEGIWKGKCGTSTPGSKSAGRAHPAPCIRRRIPREPDSGSDAFVSARGRVAAARIPATEEDRGLPWLRTVATASLSVSLYTYPTVHTISLYPTLSSSSCSASLSLSLSLSLCVPSARREGSRGRCLARGWRRGRTRWTWPSTSGTRSSTAPSTASSRSAPSAPAGWSPRTPSTASTGTNVTPNYLRFFAGDISKRQLEETLKKMCKEGAYWGAVAGVYVGMEYGVERVRGDRDWKNALLGGIATGALVSAASNNKGNKIVQDAITGGAIATAVEFINYLT